MGKNGIIVSDNGSGGEYLVKGSIESDGSVKLEEYTPEAGKECDAPSLQERPQCQSTSAPGETKKTLAGLGNLGETTVSKKNASSASTLLFSLSSVLLIVVMALL